MGEWMVQVPVKLDPETVARLDLLRGSYPFKPGRSTVIRELVEEGLRLIAEGIMQFRATASNRVPSVQSIPGTPVEFPAHIAAPIAGPKPLTRIAASKVSGARRREVHGVSRRSCVGVRWACLPPFPGKVRPFKSNSFRRVA